MKVTRKTIIVWTLIGFTLLNWLIIAPQGAFADSKAQEGVNLRCSQMQIDTNLNNKGILCSVVSEAITLNANNLIQSCQQRCETLYSNSFWTNYNSKLTNLCKTTCVQIYTP